MYNVQYEERFATEIEAAPSFMQDDFIEMYRDLQVVPRTGDRFSVMSSKERADAYHMLFADYLAWITYTVTDEPTRMVKVYRLVNARDLL